MSPLATKLKKILEQSAPTTYSQIAPLVQVHHRSRKFHAALGELVINGRPDLAKKVRQKATGRPGPGFDAICKQYGIIP